MKPPQSGGKTLLSDQRVRRTLSESSINRKIRKNLKRKPATDVSIFPKSTVKSTKDVETRKRQVSFLESAHPIMLGRDRFNQKHHRVGPKLGRKPQCASDSRSQLKACKVC